MKLGYFVSKKIDQLTKKADSAMQCGKYLKAIAYYKKIIEILPEPKETMGSIRVGCSIYC